MEEADAYGLDLAMRWLAVKDWRSVECSEPVNRKIVDGTMSKVEPVIEVWGVSIPVEGAS